MGQTEQTLAIEGERGSRSAWDEVAMIARDHHYAIIGLLFYIGAGLLPGNFGIPADSVWFRIGETFGGALCILCGVTLAWRMNSLIPATALSIALLIPVVQILAYLIIVGDAARRIRGRGYKLGLLGAAKPTAAPSGPMTA
ncbi:MAG: hypothetical protein KDB14_14255 [Planctomycetales bacterium]|nr:hypothetical protein [Planctomycetales bacterium]